MKLTTKAGRYDWTGWERETDLGNDDDREGVWFLTIREDGEELAIIVHRTCGGKYPLDHPWATAKEAAAARIVEALALFDDVEARQQ